MPRSCHRSSPAKYADLGDHNFFATGNIGTTNIQRWLNMNMAIANAAGIPSAYGTSNWSPGDTYDVTQKNLAGYVSTKWGSPRLTAHWPWWWARA
jgi:iron complex outermembrane receptor protein